MNDIKKQELELRERVSAVRTQQNYIESQLILYVRNLDDLIYTIHTPKHEFLFKSTFNPEVLAGDEPSIISHPDLLYSEYIKESMTTLLDTINKQYCSTKWNTKLSGFSKVPAQIQLLFTHETIQTLTIEIDLNQQRDTLLNRLKIICNALDYFKEVVHEWPSLMGDAEDFHKTYGSSSSFAKAAVAIKQKRMQHICNLVVDGKAVTRAINFVEYICNIMISATYLYGCLNGALEYPCKDILEFALTGSGIQNKPWWINDDDDDEDEDDTNTTPPDRSIVIPTFSDEQLEEASRKIKEERIRVREEEAEKKREKLLPVMD